MPHSAYWTEAYLYRLGLVAEDNSAPSEWGTRKLMNAILESAVSDFLKYGRRQGRRADRLTREAEAWLWKNDDTWIFSCVHVCAVLGINLSRLRQGLLQKSHDPYPTYKPLRRQIGRIHAPL